MTIQMTLRLVRAALVVKVQGRIAVCPRATWILPELTDTSRGLTRPVKKGTQSSNIQPLPCGLAMPPFSRSTIHECGMAPALSQGQQSLSNHHRPKRATSSPSALQNGAIFPRGIAKGKGEMAAILTEDILASVPLKITGPILKTGKNLQEKLSCPRDNERHLKTHPTSRKRALLKLPKKGNQEQGF